MASKHGISESVSAFLRVDFFCVIWVTVFFPLFAHVQCQHTILQNVNKFGHFRTRIVNPGPPTCCQDSLTASYRR